MLISPKILSLRSARSMLTSSIRKGTMKRLFNSIRKPLDTWTHHTWFKDISRCLSSIIWSSIWSSWPSSLRSNNPSFLPSQITIRTTQLCSLIATLRKTRSTRLKTTSLLQPLKKQSTSASSMWRLQLMCAASTRPQETKPLHSPISKGSTLYWCRSTLTIRRNISMPSILLKLRLLTYAKRSIS